MTGRISSLVVLGTLFVVAAAQVPYTHAQVFPYLAPQAPEFDDQGRPTENKPARTAPPENNWSVTTPQRPGQDTGNNSAKPSMPQVGSRIDPARRVAPQAPDLGSAPSQGPYGPTRPARTTPAVTTPTGPPSGQVQTRSDCSQYPALIAQARSEAEMRAVAVQYLTCLVNNGWDQNTAKNHVISVIETSYRLIR